MPILNIKNKTFVATESHVDRLNKAKEEFRAELKSLKEIYETGSQKLAKAYFEKVYKELGYNDEDNRPVLRIDDEYNQEGVILIQAIDPDEAGEENGNDTTH